MNKIRKFMDRDINPIHSTIFPADIREGDCIKARVRSLDPAFALDSELRVWRLSPLGIEVILPAGVDVPRGLHIQLDLTIGDQRSALNGLIVDDISSRNNSRLLHIRLIPRAKERIGNTERRQSARWLCSEQFYPTAVATNPVQFNDLLYFRIREVSSEGFRLFTSLRNKFIVPGMVFECLANFPMISQITVKVQVRNVRVEQENGKEMLAIGVIFEKGNKELQEIVAQYLIQFGEIASPLELLTAGLPVNHIASAVQYSFVKTKEEYEKVLKLRHQTYLEAGKIGDDLTPVDMADEFDARARIVIGKYRGEVVASARIVYSQQDETLEQERFIHWSNDLPRKDDVVEIMRACTRSDFRGSDLLLGMFKFMAVTVAQSRRRWIVICASDEMTNFYEKIGFRKTGLSYPHPKLNNTNHSVMVANFLQGMTGNTVGPIYWNLVWSDSVKYLSQYSFITPDPMINIRLGIYRLFAPLANWLYNRKVRLRKSAVSYQHKSPQIAA